ncbi:hypothetical protein OG937_02505 [Streptomyces sp. NBC_00510]
MTLEDAGGDRAKLNVHLAGPDNLGYLDHIRVVDNDDKERQLAHEVDVTQAQIDAHVWGPFKFMHGADGADAHGRRSPPSRSPWAAAGRSRRCADPGHWMGTRTAFLRSMPAVFRWL